MWATFCHSKWRKDPPVRLGFRKIQFCKLDIDLAQIRGAMRLNKHKPMN